MKPYIILALLVAVAFANSLQNQFVWDDHALIIDLPLKEIPSTFTTPLWKMAGFNEYQQTYYRPVTFIFYALNYKIWGMNPIGFHLSDIALHLISAIVLYKIGLLLLNNDTLISLIGASIFAVHPVNNEPVGRAASHEVILGFFIILSIYFFLKEKRYLSWIAYSFALFSKEAAVMLPFALLTLSTHKKGIKRGVIEIMPYIALVGIYLVIRAAIVSAVFGETVHQPAYTRMLTMAAAAFDYIRLLIIPYPLSPFYAAR